MLRSLARHRSAKPSRSGSAEKQRQQAYLPFTGFTRGHENNPRGCRVELLPRFRRSPRILRRVRAKAGWSGGLRVTLGRRTSKVFCTLRTFRARTGGGWGRVCHPRSALVGVGAQSLRSVRQISCRPSSMAAFCMGSGVKPTHTCKTAFRKAGRFSGGTDTDTRLCYCQQTITSQHSLARGEGMP